ncbi:MAG: hypothetical protein AAF497_17365, partial [Planctomycetota bacterium]
GPVVIAGRPFTESLPAQPKGKGEINIDVKGLDARRFRIDFGADYPQGQVTKYQRHTYSARVNGSSARYLTVIEPFENTSKTMVSKVEALSADKLRIELTNGTVDEITITGLDGDRPKVKLRQNANGYSRTESTTEQ